MRSSVTLLVASIVLEPAAATFRDWNKAPIFSCPSNTDNKCNDQEKSGWDFSSIPVGSFNSYGSFSFDGFSCKGDSKTKRDILIKRGAGFGGKSISGTASKSSGPSFSCGGADDKFSIQQYYVSVDRNTDVEFQYSMPDGSKCSHVTSSQTSGTVVQNSQCGGAVGVSIQLPKHEDGDCGIDIHGIDFDCSPPQQPPINKPPPEQPQPKSSQTPPTESATPPKPSDTPPKESSTPPKQSATPPKQSDTPPRYSDTPPKYSDTLPKHSDSPPKESGVPPKQSDTPPKQSDTPPKESAVPPKPSDTPPKGSVALPIPSSAAEVPSYSSKSPVVSEKPSVPGSLPSSAPYTPSSKLPSGSESSLVSGPNASSKPGPAPPAPTGTCPDVLPKCLSTWTYTSTCNGNTDKDCYCKDEKLIASVYDCLSAWGEDDEEIQAAISYLIGICGEYIPSNPGIITNCPSSIPIKPTPAPTVPAASNIPQQPITVITVSQTLSVPCTYTEGSSKGQTIPSSFTQSTIQTTVTVPQVAFTTGASGIALVPGPTPAATGAYSAATTLAASKTDRPSSNVTASAVPEQFQGAAPKMVGSWIAGSVAIVAAVLFSL